MPKINFLAKNKTKQVTLALMNLFQRFSLVPELGQAKIKVCCIYWWLVPAEFGPPAREIDILYSDFGFVHFVPRSTHLPNFKCWAIDRHTPCQWSWAVDVVDTSRVVPDATSVHRKISPSITFRPKPKKNIVRKGYNTIGSSYKGSIVEIELDNSRNSTWAPALRARVSAFMRAVLFQSSRRLARVFILAYRDWDFG